jgi:hypothetical protein
LVPSIDIFIKVSTNMSMDRYVFVCSVQRLKRKRKGKGTSPEVKVVCVLAGSVCLFVQPASTQHVSTVER